jgi:hypothetical protein
MKHLILWYHIISFTMGFAAIMVAFLIYLNNRLKVIKYYILFLLSLTLFTILNIVNVYRYTIANNFDSSITILTFILFFISLGSMAYSIPTFFHLIIGVTISRIKKWIVSSIASLSIIFIFIPYLLGDTNLEKERILKFEIYYIYSPIVLCTVFLPSFLF